jgi:hypothetical protein
MPNSAARKVRCVLAEVKAPKLYWGIPFDRLCDALGIGHRLTKSNHPWTNGQVERMNRAIKDATVKLTTTRHTII